jgi:hypothetical protein
VSSPFSDPIWTRRPTVVPFKPRGQGTLPGLENHVSQIPIRYFQEIQPSLDAADFVEGLLIEGAMSVIYGESNSGKTFWVLDLALHVATGKTWLCREVEQKGVIWLAMEGAHGVSNRVAAWREEQGIDVADVPFAIIPVALNLLDPEADTNGLIEVVAAAAERMGMPVGLIVVDTLARAIAGGNENASEDMGALVMNGDRIREVTTAHVAWIHHSGKDQAKGARGHSSLRAATDTEIEITADGQQRKARVVKQRELDCAGEFEFILKVVSLGVNKRGKPVTSCVVEGCVEGHTAGAVPSSRLSGHPRRALEVLYDLLAESGKGGFRGTPPGVNSVPADWWRDRFYERACPGDNQDAKKKAFQRASAKLIEMHVVAMGGERVWVPRFKSEKQESQGYQKDG